MYLNPFGNILKSHWKMTIWLNHPHKLWLLCVQNVPIGPIVDAQREDSEVIEEEQQLADAGQLVQLADAGQLVQEVVWVRPARQTLNPCPPSLIQTRDNCQIFYPSTSSLWIQVVPIDQVVEVRREETEVKDEARSEET